MLPEDTLRLCPGDSLLLVNQYDAVSGYLWSTEDTTKQIWVYESGWYGLELTWSGCGSSIDSVFVDDAEPILGSVLSIPASDSLHPDGSLIFIPDPLSQIIHICGATEMLIHWQKSCRLVITRYWSLTVMGAISHFPAQWIPGFASIITLTWGRILPVAQGMQLCYHL